MGKGDKKTKRGKVTIGTFGRLRPRKSNKVKTAVESPKPAKAKKATKKPAKKAS